MAVLEFILKNEVGFFPIVHDISVVWKVNDNKISHFPDYRLLQFVKIQDDLNLLKLWPFFGLIFNSGKTFFSYGIAFSVSGVCFYNISKDLFSFDDIKREIEACTLYYRNALWSLKAFLPAFGRLSIGDTSLEKRYLCLFDLSERLFLPEAIEELVFESNLGSSKFQCTFSNFED